MMAMLTQTKDAIDRLKAAGFKRREFKVRTFRNKSGEYPDLPNIHIKRRVTGADIPNLLANGFDVLAVGWIGGPTSFVVIDREYGEPARVKVIAC